MLYTVNFALPSVASERLAILANPSIFTGDLSALAWCVYSNYGGLLPQSQVISWINHAPFYQNHNSILQRPIRVIRSTTPIFSSTSLSVDPLPDTNPRSFLVMASVFMKALQPLCARRLSSSAVKWKIFDVASAGQFKTDVLGVKGPVIVDFHAE